MYAIVEAFSVEIQGDYTNLLSQMRKLAKIAVVCYCKGVFSEKSGYLKDSYATLHFRNGESISGYNQCNIFVIKYLKVKLIKIRNFVQRGNFGLILVILRSKNALLFGCCSRKSRHGGVGNE